MQWLTSRSVKTTLFVGAFAVLFSGCFSYLPVEPAVIPQGSDVRLEMTRLGFAALPELPNEAGPALSGELLSHREGHILLRVPIRIRRDGTVVGSVDQDLTIPIDQVLRWEKREFNRVRTGLAVAGGLAGAIGLYVAFGSGGPPVGEEPPRPPDGEAGGLARIELFSIPLRSLGW